MVAKASSDGRKVNPTMPNADLNDHANQKVTNARNLTNIEFNCTNSYG
jgi:hypothetical protein